MNPDLSPGSEGIK